MYARELSCSSSFAVLCYVIRQSYLYTITPRISVHVLMPGSVLSLLAKISKIRRHGPADICLLVWLSGPRYYAVDVLSKQLMYCSD